MTEDHDPYAVLGVAPLATPAEINHAFRAKLRALHPDTGYRDATGAPADTRLRQLIAAYHLLRDPENRARHDRDTRNGAAARRQERPIPSPSRRASASPDGPQTIPVTRYQRQPPVSGYLLWAGPVRRHR